MKTLIFTTAFLFINFDLFAKIIYVEPVRNAKYVSVNNNIIIGFDEIISSTNLNSLIRVTGTQSGVHQGEIIITSDRKKLIFKPAQPFAFNETVEVKLNNLKTSFTSNNKLTYTFQTEVTKLTLEPGDLMSDESEYTPHNQFVHSDNYGLLPQLTVNISNNPSPGRIFLNTFATFTYPAHLIIANNDGTQYYTREMPERASNFERQPNGLMTYFSNSGDKFYAENSQYTVVDSFYSGNGFITDSHELVVLNNGHAYVMSYNVQFIDMSQIVPGGHPNARVVGLIIQEIDENKNVVFQWRSWDHFQITDAMFVNLTAQSVDYVHGNAIEYDTDGNIMISSRHLNEITKINTSTGDMIWRLGGLNNQFTFVNDSLPFRYQHNIKRIANGNVTLLDNGNFRPPLFSRAVEYHLDEVNKVATLIWEYRNNPVIYGPNRGGAQRLRNGNTLICWGGTNPTLTEVTPAGNIALEMNFPQGVYSYRAFRDEVNLTLNIKLALEGFYNNQTNLLNMNDTVKAYVRSINSPYNVLDSAAGVVDSTNLNGNFRFYNLTSGTYYVTIKHRNSLETWSKDGGESFDAGGVYLYDFTTSNSQAYGNNLVLKGSKYCIYSGDVNQNGNVDGSDLGIVDNDAFNFVTGYVRSDVNGNNVSDAADLTIVDNNVLKFVSKLTPP